MSRQGQRREVKLFFIDVWPGEEGGLGQLGQFQRHVVGGGVNHLGGRRGGVGCGFSGPGDPCGERNTAFDSTLLSSGSVLEGKSGGGGGSGRAASSHECSSNNDGEDTAMRPVPGDGAGCGCGSSSWCALQLPTSPPTIARSPEPREPDNEEPDDGCDLGRSEKQATWRTRCHEIQMSCT